MAPPEARSHLSMVVLHSISKGRCVNIRILGCHGSDQLVITETTPLSCRPCAFLINDTLLVDAGTIGSKLTLSEQLTIRHVLLSHVHFDHIKELPTLADNLAGVSSAPVVIAGIPPVLASLRAHVFNWTVYPDFFALPSAGHPVFSIQRLRAGETSVLSGLRVTPIRVNHVVPTVGFIISDGESAVLYSGDTHQTDEIWQVAAGVPELKAAFIETSYPDEEADLARQAKHLTPSLLASEFRKIGRPDLPVYVYHVKPRFRDRIRKQVQAAGMTRAVLLEEEHKLTV